LPKGLLNKMFSKLPRSLVLWLCHKTWKTFYQLVQVLVDKSRIKPTIAAYVSNLSAV